MCLSASASAAGTAFNWTGLYTGLQGFYGSGKIDWEYDNSGNSANHNYYGAMGGLFLGYNYQLPVNAVFGFEIDLNAGKISGSGLCPNPLFTANTDISWLGSARARAGYAFYRFLPYVAFGVAYVRADIYTKRNGVEYGEEKTYVGWTPSIGLEYAFTNNLVARMEYAYYDFNRQHFRVDNGLSVEGRLNLNALKFGLIWKF